MSAEANSPDPPQREAAADGGDFARRVARARHDLRNPVAHILGFSEMLIEKAGEQSYNFLKGRIKIIERLGNEMVEQINGSLEPRKIEGGQSNVRALQQLIRRCATRIASLTDTLGRKPNVRADERLSDDIARIGGAARRLIELSETALAFLLEPAHERSPAQPEAGLTTARAGPAKQAESASAAAPTRQSLRILVVDDEEKNRETLRGLLAQLGYTAAVAADGKLALELAGRTPLDMVLLDVTMPEWDGLQTLQKLKLHRTAGSLPVVMLAESDEMELALRALELGADDYLPKPFNATLLKVRIESALARRRLRGSEPD